MDRYTISYNALMSDKKLYWDSSIDDYVVAYIKSESKAEREKIYTLHLYKPMKRLVISVLNYVCSRKGIKLSDWQYEEFQAITLVHVYNQISKFDYSKGFKSFSFFQTISKFKILSLIRTENLNMKHDDIDDYKEFIPEEVIEPLDITSIRIAIIKLLDLKIAHLQTRDNRNLKKYRLFVDFKNFIILNKEFDNDSLVEYLIKTSGFSYIQIYRILLSEGIRVSIVNFDKYKIEKKIKVYESEIERMSSMKLRRTDKLLVLKGKLDKEKKRLEEILFSKKKNNNQ